MTTQTKTAHTAGTERAFQRLVSTFPESALRNYPEDVKSIIDRETAAPEMLEALTTARFVIQVALDAGQVSEKNVRSTLNQIDAAIQKARGQQ